MQIGDVKTTEDRKKSVTISTVKGEKENQHRQGEMRKQQKDE